MGFDWVPVPVVGWLVGRLVMTHEDAEGRNDGDSFILIYCAVAFSSLTCPLRSIDGSRALPVKDDRMSDNSAVLGDLVSG